MKRQKKEDNNYTDKTRAKAELIVGFTLIIVLLVYTKVTDIGNNYNYDYNNINTNTTNSSEVVKKDKFSLDNINDNYSFDIDVKYTTKKDDNEVEELYGYKGSVYKENKIIYKIIGNNTSTYYVKGDKFYIKDIDKYQEVSDYNSLVFNLIDYKYLTLVNLKEYISKATLDHTTNYSNGNVSYVYNLLISEIDNGYKGEDCVNIEVNVINKETIITVNYTSLLKLNNSDLQNCEVSYKYSNINKVDEFVIDIQEVEEKNEYGNN